MSGSEPPVPRQAHSLKRRLVSVILAAIALASLLQASSAYRNALQQADALFDEQLQSLARSIRGGLPIAPDGVVDYHALDLLVQIWTPDGVSIFRSVGPPLPSEVRLGFSDVTLSGTRYRIYALQTPQYVVQIAQDLDARRRRARVFAARAIAPVALIAPVLMAAVWWLINLSLAPLGRMREQIAGRKPDDLSPLTVKKLPQEVLPLADELNLLFGRLQTAFAAQQAFVADAAHELRSPLAAIKLQAQALRRDLQEEERRAAVARLNQGIERAIALGEQLLTLAREEGSGAAEPERVDLQELARQAVGDVLQQASSRRIDVGLVTSEPVAVVGRPDALRTLLRNLLDNAAKYANAGGQVDLSLTVQGGRACMTVEDSGPGIPEAERERVFDRFVRLSGTTGEGNGLGLAIVRTIAAQHHASVRLDRSQRLGGLSVEVCFPPTSDAAAGAAAGERLSPA